MNHYRPLMQLLLLALGALAASCWSNDGARDERGQSGPARNFDELEYHPEFVWDFQQAVTVRIELAAAQIPAAGFASVEVRHTHDGGSLIYRGRLNEQNGFSGEISTRIPQHETALTVTAETRDGLSRQIVTVPESGQLTARFD